MKAGIVTAFLLCLASAARAHDEKWSDSRVLVGDREVVWRVRVSIVALEKVMEFPAPAIDLSEKQLQSVKGEIVGHLRRGMGLEINGTTRTAEAGVLEPVYEELPLSGEPFIGHVDQVFRFESDEDIEEAVLALNFFGWLTEQHEAGLTVEWGELSKRYIRRGPAEIRVRYDEYHPTVWSVSRDSGLRGLQTFLSTSAAVAFLVGTLLGTIRLRESLTATGAFALSSVAAMGTAAADIVSVREGIVGALMAASVIYVAAENVLTRDGRLRWVVTLIFGLAHGFALGVPAQGALAASASILGVLAGQAAIFLVAVPVFQWIRGGGEGEAAEGRRRRVILFGSIPLALLGAAWMIEHLFAVELLPL